MVKEYQDGFYEAKIASLEAIFTSLKKDIQADIAMLREDIKESASKMEHKIETLQCSQHGQKLTELETQLKTSIKWIYFLGSIIALAVTVLANILYAFSL